MNDPLELTQDVIKGGTQQLEIGSNTYFKNEGVERQKVATPTIINDHHMKNTNPLVESYFQQLKPTLDNDILKVVKDQIYERQGYESLKIIRDELAIGSLDPKQFIENEQLKIKKHQLERIQIKQGILL